jgi:hypothetical protein
MTKPFGLEALASATFGTSCPRALLGEQAYNCRMR